MLDKKNCDDYQITININPININYSNLDEKLKKPIKNDYFLCNKICIWCHQVFKFIKSYFFK